MDIRGKGPVVFREPGGSATVSGDHRGPWSAPLPLALLLALFLGGPHPLEAQSGARSTTSTPSLNTRGVEGVDPSATRTETAGTNAVQPPEPVQAPPTGEANSAKFELKTVKFVGNRVIGTEELRPIARAFENKLVSLTDLAELRKKIRTLYQSRGYVLARAAIPPQDASQGEVTVQIFEGRYGQLRVEGQQHYQADFIERYFQSALREGVVRQQSVQRALLQLNENPDMQASSLFSKGKEKGTADLVIQVKDAEPLHATLEYNDYGTARLGRSRVGLAIVANNTLTDGDETFGRATYLLPRTSDPFFQTSYTFPLGRVGDKVSFSYSNSAVVLGADLAVLDIRGEADIFALSFQRSLERELTHSLNVSAGLQFKSAINTIFGQQLVSKDDLRMFTATIDGQRNRGNVRTLYSATITQGLGQVFGGVNSDARFADGSQRASRAGAGNELTKGNGDVFVIRRLKSGDYLIMRLDVQAASQPLPVLEQFGLGGPDSVRGYQQSEYLGDDGLSASVECRVPVYDGSDNHGQVVVFVDHGRARLKRPRAGEDATRRLSGMGTGLRLALGTHLAARLDLGFPLSGDNIELTNPVIYGQISNRW